MEEIFNGFFLDIIFQPNICSRATRFRLVAIHV